MHLRSSVSILKISNKSLHDLPNYDPINDVFSRAAGGGLWQSKLIDLATVINQDRRVHTSCMCSSIPTYSNPFCKNVINAPGGMSD
jgi:hypothetical protein